ncbi:hypothetical protein [Hymenobacter fastidiosus]|uniref:hypothetical protein n=1 Tax=Hymenobacter fastidiosus TaxID=486264 RepID=UPI0031E904CD
MGIVYQFYYGGGDTYNYYAHTKIVYQAFSDSPMLGLKLVMANGEFDAATIKYTSQMYWYKASTEYFVVRVASLCGFLCFNTYSVIALMFALLSFSGMWAMFITFVRIAPIAYKKLAFSVFFLPSVFFWGSGLMKDSLCIGALGWVFYAFYHLTIEKRNLTIAAAMGALGVYVLVSTKVYILLSFMPPALLWTFNENNQRIRSAALRALLKPVFLVLGLAAGYLGATNLTAGDEKYDVEKIGERTKVNQQYLTSGTENGSSYNIGSFDGSLSALATVAPQAVVVSLFRPFPWEARSAIMILSALESMLMLYLTVSLFYKTGVLKTFRLIISKPILTFCFIFVIIFAIGVGTNSGNFGTLVRYKIPLMPFYLAALYIMQFQANSAKKLGRFASTEKRASMVARAA